MDRRGFLRFMAVAPVAVPVTALAVTQPKVAAVVTGPSEIDAIRQAMLTEAYKRAHPVCVYSGGITYFDDDPVIVGCGITPVNSFRQ